MSSVCNPDDALILASRRLASMILAGYSPQLPLAKSSSSSSSFPRIEHKGKTLLVKRSVEP